MKYFIDSEGEKHEEPKKSEKPRAITESPYDCIKCGKPANSPAFKRYCWDCYDVQTNGTVFDL